MGCFSLLILAADVAVFAGPVIDFGLLILLLNLIAKLSWKHSAIIAAIYTGILFGVGVVIVACSAAVAGP